MGRTFFITAFVASFVTLGLFFVGSHPVLAVGSPAPFTQLTIEANQGSWGNNIGDLDHDGYPDVVEGGGDLGGSVYWYQYPAWTKHRIGSVAGGDDLQVSDINHDGFLDVVVNGGQIVWYENPLGSSGNVYGTWTPHVIDSTLGSHDIQIGDLNNDGGQDIVIRQENGPTYYYLQNTPTSWVRVSVPQAPNAHGGLVLADINRDGRTDLVENGFWLQAPTDLVNGTWIRRDIVSWPDGASANVADLNNDGRVDVLLAVSERGVGTLTWFEAPVDPISGTWIRHDIDTVEDLHLFFVVDVNKDGTPDIVFAEMHQSGTRRVGVYYNEGFGSAWSLQNLSTEGSHNIAVGDIGNDGDIDIIGANWDIHASDGGAMKLWRNDINNALSLDNWTYIQADTSRSAPATFGLAFGDLDVDGRTDIIAGRYWYRNPGGTLTSTWNRTDFGSEMDALLVTDINRDGQLDVVAQQRVSPNINVVWLKPTNAAFTSWIPIVIGTLPDVSRDTISQGSAATRLDLPGSRQLVFSMDDGHYAFTIPSVNPEAGNWSRLHMDTDGTQEDLTMRDMNQDGEIDLVGSSHTSPGAGGQEVDWWQNPGDGSGNWVKHQIGTVTNEVDRVSVADVDLDGRLDVIATDTTNSEGSGNLYWFKNNTSGTWTSQNISGSIGALNSMDVGDFNQDGKVDIIVGEHRGGGLRTLLYENVGSGTSWTAHVVDSGKESHLGTQAVDLDHD
ncbi:MAG: VCBS repeat-containing protein [Candidatus Moraniibacteriota bacterium]